MSTQTSKLQNANDKLKNKSCKLFSDENCKASSSHEVQKIWEARKKFNLKLIEEYKKEECLWNVNSKKFLIFLLKKPAWERIAANMGEDVTVDLVKNRIFIMRCQLQDEAAKEEYIKTVAIPNSKYYFAKHFAFLDDMMANRKIFTVENNNTIGKTNSKREPQTSKPKLLTKKKSILSKASTSTLIASTKSKGEKSPRRSAGKDKFASKASAKTAAFLSTESGEESSSSSISSLSSSTYYKSVKKTLLNSKTSPRSRISSKAGDESSLSPTWYTATSASASSRSIGSRKFPKVYPWEPLKFKSTSSLLKSSFKVPFKRPIPPNIQIKKEPTNSSTEMIVKKSTSSSPSFKLIKTKKVERMSSESSPRESTMSPIPKSFGKKSELEQQIKLEIENQRQLNLLNYANPPKPKRNLTFSKKIEEDDEKFFDKLYEQSEEKKLENENEKENEDNESKKPIEMPNVFYKLENYFQSMNSPAANIIANLNEQNSKEMRKDFFKGGCV